MPAETMTAKDQGAIERWILDKLKALTEADVFEFQKRIDWKPTFRNPLRVRMRKTLIISFIVLVLLGFLTWKMLHLAQKECSLCIEFKGDRKCLSALGPTDEQALEEAHRSLCAVMTSGVTDVVACQRLPREGVACKAVER